MRISAILVLLALAPLGARAQTAGPPLSPTDPSKLVAKPPAASQPITPPAPAPAPAPPPPAADQSPRFVLTSVTFEGAKAVSAEKLAAAWAPYRGRPVTLADLRAIAKAAEAAYAAAGYPFVAIVLNPQRVEEGAVRFRVIEGRISDLTVLGADPVARRQATAAFQPLVNLAPLTAADVEGAYERASSIPGLGVAGALHRGGEPGGMDLLIQAKRQEWLFYANVNNLYSDPLGPWGMLLGFDRYGGSTYGDQISGQVYEFLDGGRQTVVRGSYERGLDASGLSLMLTGLGAWANPAGDVAPLNLATDVATGRIAISQPLIARLSSSLTATTAFEIDDQQTLVYSKVGLTDDNLRIVSVALDGEWRYADSARLAMSAELRQGLQLFGASRPGDPELSRPGADPDATVTRASFLGVSPRFEKIRLVLRLDGQLASAPLTAPEQYEAGNLTIGRGYEPGAVYGDDALAGSGEVRLGPFPVLRKLSLEPFAFYDYVQVWTRTPGASIDAHIASVGGGIRLETTSHLHVDITYAQPLDPIPGFGQSAPGNVVLVNVTIGLNDVYDAIHRRLSSGGAK